jgi:hypothetical protein
MRAKAFVRTTIVTALFFVGGIDLGPFSTVFPGVSQAEAKGFYTRKRVNGEWITGEFAKRGRSAASYRRAPRRTAANARSVLAARALAAWTAADVAAVRPEPRPIDILPPPAVREAMLTPPADERLLRLQRALEARAHELVSSPGSEAVARNRPADPTSVLFDFQSGLKTTTYGSTIVMESFDVTAAKALVSPLPLAQEKAPPLASAAR